jgi:Holliday junction resolvase RusA-like endonuclease
MEICNITIEGAPIPLQRHRHRKNMNGEVKTYDPNIDDKRMFQWMAISKFNPKKPLTLPIYIDVTFCFKRPKSHYSTGKNSGMLKENVPDFHDKKPDLDNLIKFVKDSLNKIYWKDDSLIIGIRSVKIYGDKPYTKLIVHQVN